MVRFPSSVLDSLDLKAFEALRQETEGYYTERYADHPTWLRRTWKQATFLGLHASPPLRILDIGTGPGYFPYVCGRLGHYCLGLDVPHDAAFCQGARKLLGVTAIEHEVRPFTRLPETIGKFDLITAFHALFHATHAEGRVWAQDEWKFFFDHLRDDVLSSGGRVALGLNKLTHLQTEEIEADLYRYFETRGGADAGKRLIVFNPLL